MSQGNVNEKVVWEKVGNFEAIASSFEVRMVHRFYFHYIEGVRTLQIGIDSTMGHSEVIFDTKPRWLPPHEGEPISPERRAEIKDRVHQALEAMNIRHSFV